MRHAPTTRGTFAFYGDNLLPGYDNVPTWKYVAAHNIQRTTPQNQECNNCHGQADLFLTAADVDPDELEANKEVIVTEIPAAK